MVWFWCYRHCFWSLSLPHPIIDIYTKTYTVTSFIVLTNRKLWMRKWVCCLIVTLLRHCSPWNFVNTLSGEKTQKRTYLGYKSSLWLPVHWSEEERSWAILNNRLSSKPRSVFRTGVLCKWSTPVDHLRRAHRGSLKFLRFGNKTTHFSILITPHL